SGRIDRARAEAARTLDALLPYLRRGAAVVGLEPSCLLTMRDEFLVLGGERDGATPGIAAADARLLADNALLFEEFLVREKAAGRLALPLAPLHKRKVLVHGHCHQKAFEAFTPVQTVLRWIPEVDLRVVESSCCGMAGAFGFERKHFDVSTKMAEAALLPAVREAGDEALIVADGTSCRHQILDGAQRHALHVAQVLAESVYRASTEAGR
ncbi:MAG: FAD-binding oxidoreductase, partial [Burkholderiaceae bacterium]